MWCDTFKVQKWQKAEQQLPGAGQCDPPQTHLSRELWGGDRPTAYAGAPTQLRSCTKHLWTTHLPSRNVTPHTYVLIKLKKKKDIPL